MCIVNDAFRQDGCLANEWNTNPGTETSVGDVINTFNILHHQMFHLMEAMMDSVVLIKHLMMEEEMESLILLQVKAGLGFFLALQALQTLCSRVMAQTTLLRLWECSR